MFSIVFFVSFSFWPLSGYLSLRARKINFPQQKRTQNQTCFGPLFLVLCLPFPFTFFFFFLIFVFFTLKLSQTKTRTHTHENPLKTNPHKKEKNRKLRTHKTTQKRKKRKNTQTKTHRQKTARKRTTQKSTTQQSTTEKNTTKKNHTEKTQKNTRKNTETKPHRNKPHRKKPLRNKPHRKTPHRKNTQKQTTRQKRTLSRGPGTQRPKFHRTCRGGEGGGEGKGRGGEEWGRRLETTSVASQREAMANPSGQPRYAATTLLRNSDCGVAPHNVSGGIPLQPQVSGWGCICTHSQLAVADPSAWRSPAPDWLASVTTLRHLLGLHHLVSPTLRIWRSTDSFGRSHQHQNRWQLCNFLLATTCFALC